VGQIQLSNATLFLDVAPEFGGEVNDLFFLVQNDGTDPISGGVNMPEGAVFSAGAQKILFRIGYKGDSATNSFTGGNDLVVQYVGVPEPNGVALALSSIALLGTLCRFPGRSICSAKLSDSNRDS
jgi:hypothetical protein